MIYKIKIQDIATKEEDFVIMGDSYKSFREHFIDIISHWTERWYYANEGKYAECFGRTIRKNILEGAIPLNAFEEMIYKIEGEDLYLIGTAEHAINAYYYNKEIPESKLPLRFAGISTCFRKELGSHGKDTKGIFRVHQFEKVEQFIFCKPEDAWKEFELILDNSRQLLKLLEIPFRFVILSSQDMGRVPTKTIDFECYFPSQNAYRELGSCSNCTDYQSRRSNIKYQKGGEIKFVYTLNNTAISTARFMDCFVDNHQQEDGSIKIPKSLFVPKDGLSIPLFRLTGQIFQGLPALNRKAILNISESLLCFPLQIV